MTDRTNARRTGRTALHAGMAGFLLVASGSAFAQGAATQGGGLGGAALREKPSGSTGLTAGPGSGITSEPPARPIAGTNTGGMASSGTQGTSGGNNESGGGKGMPGPTGSGTPGSGAGAAPIR